MHDDTKKLNLQDTGLHFRPDTTKVIPRFMQLGNSNRERSVFGRICTIPEQQVDELLREITDLFAARHRDSRGVFREHYDRVKVYANGSVSPQRQLLIGAYFTMEYSIEAAALFNPSIVPHPDQRGVGAGGLRVILSLRAVGEGHISSILFKCGIVGPDGDVTVDEDGRFFESGAVTPGTGTAYELSFDRDLPLSSRVIFPATEDERQGIEDARFVQFNGETTRYYATVTAWNGSGIVQKLIETDDFEQFRVIRLNGACAGNKGMALFPEKIDGRYAMISRHDNENLFIAFSDDVYTWEEPRLLLKPEEPWELTQIGNCGSPVKTDRGWLLLTHGVGPVRRYCMGAVLLDLIDPSRVIATLPTPLLCPSEDGRNGYVPNVVYSCGAIVHQGMLIVPYAVSDSSSRIFKVNLDELIDHMEQM